MPKYLYGNDLASYIKERQAHQVRALLANNIKPKLVIIKTIDDPIINIYVRLKKQYAQDISIQVEEHIIKQSVSAELVSKLNADKKCQGIIIQLPLEDPSQTSELVQLIDPKKDVDSLGSKTTYPPATPTAIMWLLAGHNINLKDKNILIIGKGKLVGQPLYDIFRNSELNVTVVDRQVDNLAKYSLKADLIISATGSPHILKADMVKPKTIIIDAGLAEEDGRTFGDADESLFERSDIIITPKKGGVGPLTICALFENLLLACQSV